MCETTIIVTALASATSLKAPSSNAKAQTLHQNNLTIPRQQEMEVNQTLANRASALQQFQITQIGRYDLRRHYNRCRILGNHCRFEGS